MIRLILILLFVSVSMGQDIEQLLEGKVKDQQLIGVLSVSYLYQSYLNIGLLADATSGDIYSPDESLLQLGDLLGVIGGVRDEIYSYSKQVESESDKLYLESLVRIADLLLQEAGALMRYFETSEDSYAQQYLELNELAQQAINQILGMESE